MTNFVLVIQRIRSTSSEKCCVVWQRPLFRRKRTVSFEMMLLVLISISIMPSLFSQYNRKNIFLKGRCISIFFWFLYYNSLFVDYSGTRALTYGMFQRERCRFISSDKYQQMSHCASLLVKINTYSCVNFTSLLVHINTNRCLNF